MGTYVSTKTYGHEVGISCAFRQWRAESHCRLIHGYAIAVKFEFEATELDYRNWVVDFGGLKTLKGIIEDNFDHKLLVAEDDPYIDELVELGNLGLADVNVLPKVGCEACAEFIAGATATWLESNGYGDRVKVRSVEVKEHGANSAVYYPDPGEFD